MSQLRTLSLHFLSLPPRRNYLRLPPQPGERVVLPALTRLKYRGTSKYLDGFVARIDAPGLGDIDITFFSQPTMDVSELGRFIERIEMQTSLSRADVQTSAHAISVSFSNSSTSSPLRLQISCKQLDWQLSSMAQVCDQFSPFLSRVKNLVINTTQSSSGQDDVGGEQWLELVRAFGGAIDFRVAGVHVTDILCALRLANGGNTADTIALPALRNLQVEKPMAMHGPSWDAVKSFITSRTLSGRLVQVYAREYSCHICHASFTMQQELRTHLVDKHAYRIVCSYCGDFEWKPGYSHQFRELLERKHPEVARNDALISNPFLASFELDNLVTRHSSLQTPDMVEVARNDALISSPLLAPLQLDNLVTRYNSLRTPDTVAPSATVTAPHSQKLDIPTPEETPARTPEETPARPNDTPPLFRRILRTLATARPVPK